MKIYFNLDELRYVEQKTFHSYFQKCENNVLWMFYKSFIWQNWIVNILSQLTMILKQLFKYSKYNFAIVLPMSFANEFVREIFFQRKGFTRFYSIISKNSYKNIYFWKYIWNVTKKFYNGFCEEIWKNFSQIFNENDKLWGNVFE